MALEVGSKRVSVRRAVKLRCDVHSDLWDGAVSYDVGNLSPEGIWLASSTPLEPGEDLLVSFAPPGRDIRLHALATVSRVGMWRRTQDPWPLGMGLSFTHLGRRDLEQLRRALIGIPPPLPRRSRGGSARRKAMLMPPRLSTSRSGIRRLLPPPLPSARLQPAIDARATLRLSPGDADVVELDELPLVLDPAAVMADEKPWSALGGLMTGGVTPIRWATAAD
jgi:hypothetical protein